MTTDPGDNAGFRSVVATYLAGRESQFNYDALVHTFTDVDRFRRWAALLDGLHPLAGATVLSSGCGAGGSLVAYHEAGATRVFGVEVDATFAAMSAQRVADLAGVEAHHLPPAGRLPLADRSVDVIESMDVIEHTGDAEGYLRELRRVLAPGGLILVVTPNRLWPVEQHLSITGPPWLPIGLADRVFMLLSRLPFLSRERRLRYHRLTGMRTQNLSLWRLRQLARAVDMHLRVLHRGDDPDSPMTPDNRRAERLLATPLGKYLAPVKSLAVTLERRA